MSNKELSLLELRQAVLQKKMKERIKNSQIGETRPLDEKRQILPRKADQQTLPLSWAQQRLWFLAQLDPAAQTAYHIPGGLRLQGYLNLDALQAALDRIVARHEILRTTIKMVEGQALQFIDKPECGFCLATDDLSHLPAKAQQTTIEGITQRETHQPFNFAQGPLIRGRLLRLAENEHILLITQHHIISDGWSLNILMQELATLYPAFSQGRDDPLPALTLQYADYALWQRAWLREEVLEKQVNFWRDALQGAPALLELPTDRPRPEKQSYAGGYVEIALSPALSAGLRSLSQRHGTTLFMTLMAGWAILLSRLSGQKDLVIGTPIANRQHSELEPLIGFFVNTLALRLQLDGNPTVSALLTQVKTHALEAYAHQDLPFEQLVEALKPPRSLSHSPIFQVMMSVDNTPGQQNITLPNITIREMNLAENSSHFDLSLAISDTEQGLVGGLEYASDLFDHASVERIAGYLQTLLTAMVEDDAQPVENLPLLQPDQRTQLLVDFNAVDFNEVAFPSPQASLIHQRLEQQVEQTPDAIALVSGDSQLSYAALNRHANQLAHHLIAFGVRPDDRVAICVERSLDMIIGIYAILKAGAGYIPLDPEYPAERLAYQLSDSQPVLLLTQQHLATRLPIQDIPVWLLDDQQHRDDVAKQPTHNPDPRQLGLKPHHLAYIIYTSGSTGQPKGVMLEHRNVVNFIQAQHQTSEPKLGDRILQFATIAFDTSVSDIFPTLASGATLVLRPPHIRIPDMTFVNYLREQKITIMDMPTAFWHYWVQEMMAGRSGFSPYLHTIIVGGEKAEYRHLMSWLSHPETQGCRWINSYGPTETTVIATTLKLDNQNPPHLEGVIPIGYPLPNTHIYILDPHGQPVPIGVSGEIHIGGAGIARGYLNRPDLTAEKFVADPFSTQPDARMYKTGDLGRWLPDGTIEYLGRNDFQVKIRGFRIELGEIEAQLAACDGVSDAVVIARDEGTGDKRLVAYFIPQTGITLSPAELRKQLSTRLMDHMLPSAFVMLDAFPMSANGKLDRKALPAPDGSAIVSRDYEAPHGETEQKLAAIWQSLLNVEQVGRHDNFFELGGHSLLVVNLIEQLRAHDLSLDVSAVFSAPTLAAMSALIRHHHAHTTTIQAVPPNRIREGSSVITPDMLPLVKLTQDQIAQIVSRVTGGIANVQDIYPLGPLQEGILFHHLLETEGDLYLDNHLMTFDNRTRLDNFLQALQQVIDRHDILRSAVHWQALLKPVQVVHRHAPLPISELTLSAEESAESQLRRLTARLDITQAPLLAAYIAKDPGSEQWRLSLLYHHLVCDHVSLDMIFGEIQTLLLGESEKLPTPLPYRNFIAQVCNVPLEVHQTYFRELLADVEEPTLPFGLLDVQGNNQDEIVENVFTLEDELARQIRNCARQLGMSAAVLFHVAWAQVLAQCSGRNDVIFGTVLLGRLQGGIGASEVLGMFINTLPIRVKLQAHSVKQAVQETYQQLTTLLEHEQAPLAVAQRCSGIQAPLPLFNSLLNFRHSPREDEQVASIAWEGIHEIESEERSNYPLSLDVDDFDDGFSLTAQCHQQINPARINGYMKMALEGIVAALQSAPEQPIQSVDILPLAERHQLLADFNDTVRDYPQDTLIHQLFEQQAARTPDATALVFGESELSYAALNRHANQLAHQLMAFGVRPDDRVAICVERSLEMIIGLYGILKAGAGYIPLDPEYPAERLAYQLSDSKPVLLLTQRHLQGRLPTPDLPVWLLDDETHQDQVAKQPAHNPDANQLDVKPHHLAYIIYTSGSTGQPKGVMLEHRNVVNFIHAQHQTSEPKEGDRILQFATIAFDTSVSDIFPTLASGATLVLRPPHIRIPDMAFVNFLREQKITIMDMPTAFWHHWVQEMMAGRSGFSPDLHTIIVGGEKAEYRHLMGWLSHPETQACRWINSYGPTETTVIATTLTINDKGQDPLELTEVIPIGYPLPNTRIYILDSQGRPAPIGVRGEIHIAGAGVARGYLNRPDLTAEKFVADPFSAQPDARMYKTGDLGRWLPDGTIEYLGRNDFQVKIRGFRVELGEIEAQLAACDGVSDAVVIAREAGAGDKRLVAYLIPQTGMTLSPVELRKQLGTRLMDHMLPSAFVMLDAFPMSANGKLDRKALPAPDRSAIVNREYEAPQGETEQKLAAIWQSLLDVEQVGRHDNFFELGGHSLRVVSLIEQLRQQGLSLEVSAVFSSPTLAAMSARLNQGDDHATDAQAIPPNLIRADSQHITPDMLPLVTLTQAQIDQIVARVPGGVANIQDIYPLGPLQEGILFHHLREETGDTYLENILMNFDNRARLEGFLQALQRVIDRHDIQRSAFHWQALPMPVQVVYRHAPLPITELSLSAQESAETQLRRLTDPDTIRLAITQAPLLAAYIAKDPGSDRWWLSLLHHHLVCDHLSLEIIFSEVQALILGEEAPLPAPLPYRNFIAQTRRVPIEVHQAYFRQLLGDVEEPTLPFGLLDVQGNNHDQIVEDSLILDDELAQQIRDSARQLGISAAVLFHVAWAQVLAQCCGREDVVFGTVLLGRLQGGIGASQVLGMFINTLPIRIPLHTRTVKQAVQETYQRLSELLDHEQTPLAIAQRCSGVQASLPLFNSLLNFRHSPREEEQSSSHAWDGIQELDSEERSNYPLSLDVDDFDDGFSLTAQCSPQINPARMNGYMEMALGGIVAALQSAPEQPIQSVDILPLAERHQVLVDFNNTVMDYPQDTLIHQLFEQQAARTPDATALVFGENALSYAALNRHANQLAHQLVAFGVRPDDRVAICVERSPEMIIGLYGILKAGAGYIPLDPEYPAERLAYQLSDSKPALLLTQRHLQGRLPTPDLPVWLLDDEAHQEQVAKQPSHNPDPRQLRLEPHHLAYIIYTSGSTGQPKGVMLEHRNVVNFIHAQHKTSEPKGGDRILQFATIAFDTSVSDIFPTLAAGATLVLRPAHIRVPDQEFVNLLNEQRITILDMPTAFWHQWVQEMTAGRSGFSPYLHTIIVGGEKAEYRHLMNWLSHPETQACRWINSYGPTETTVIATTLKVKNPQNGDGTQSTEFSDNIPIGYPLPNTRIYILDAFGRPTPLGISGEIYIGGAGVARGYLNRPDLTAEKFVADPFSQQPNARMYKTGDLGRWLPHGVIEYLGRNDFQVKIRGFRIELGEVEARLVQCQGVQEAIVLVREIAPDDKRLVAYVQPQSGAKLHPNELRQQLAQHLADYMLPSAFVTLDAFPLTANGKIDRQAFPAPDQSAIVAREYEAPQGEIEIVLAQIWQDLLGVARVSRHDHFFELGGHSLLILKACSLAVEKLGLSQNRMASLMAFTTIKDQAKAIEDRENSNVGSMVGLSRNTNATPLFFAPGTGGHVLYLRELATALEGTYSVWGMRSPELDGRSDPPQSLEAMASVMIESLKKVQPNGPYHLGGHSFGGWLAFEMARQLVQQGESIGLLAVVDSESPLESLSEKIESAWSDSHWLAEFGNALAASAGAEENFTEEEFQSMTEAEQLDRLRRRLIAEELLPPQFEPREIATYLGVFKAHSLVTYQPQGRYPGALQLFLADDNQPDISTKSRVDGWQALVTGEVIPTTLAGDHITLMRPPFVQDLAAAIAGVNKSV
ncbi:non-ribosomal peptide synthetase [Xenorhabdus kozodoii]|uniref:Amino acid adenylation n=1 Tax=Xenorhabdus kozodoii TaxID=351676 RepID=A0A2D0LGZ5_9GAMM|nr:non-ribosomal peptide synthetase [Xenorhabdus kozodoii]PHM70060.1 Amino acid adenylation [Xenorhabdus kozodoii]PHM74996.1 Amino acid adenylation [Xenorhabdus kozodoii]